MIEDINKIRRLRILQFLYRAQEPRGEQAILVGILSDPELSPTVELVRQSVHWLEQHLLIQLIQIKDSDWVAAQILPEGIQYLTNTDFIIDGIYKPEEKPPIASESNFKGRNSSVKALPVDVKAWLDAELVRRNFTDYRELAELLKERGYEISKSAVHRYGSKFKQEQEGLRQTIEEAKALAATVGDDGAAMSQTLIALAQKEAYSILRDKRFVDKVKVTDLLRSIATLNRSDINTKKFQVEQEIRQKALEDAAKAIEKTGKQAGVSQSAIDIIRRDVLQMSS